MKIESIRKRKLRRYLRKADYLVSHPFNDKYWRCVERINKIVFSSGLSRNSYMRYKKARACLFSYTFRKNLRKYAIRNRY